MAASSKTNHKPKSSRARKRRLAQKQAKTLRFERLEAKHLLASVTVGNAIDLTNAPDVTSISALLANDGGDGISLREAIAASNNTAGLDTLTFDASLFTGGAASLIRLTQGELEITESLTIDASAATEVTISGDAVGDDITLPGTFITDVDATLTANADSLNDNSRVINFSAAVGTLSMVNVTVTGGRASVDLDGGGGILASSGNVSLVNSNLMGNSTSGDTFPIAGSQGGGISTSSGDVSLTNSTLSRNRTSSFRAKGGGIYTDSGNVLLTNSTLSENRTGGSGASGGGIYARLGDVSLIDGSNVSGNSTSGLSSSGGGIFTASGDLSVTDSTVVENNTSGTFANGGGIRAGSGDVSLINSTVSENSTLGDRADGGGIWGTLFGTVSLVDSAVIGNSTFGELSHGGGIFNYSGSVSLVDSELNKNNTSGRNARGGGIYSKAGDVTVADSTVSENSTINLGASGGGIYLGSGSGSLNNSTLSQNSTSGDVADGGGIFANAATVSLANSTVYENSTGGDQSDGGGIATTTGSMFVVDSTVSGNSVSGYLAGGGGLRTVSGDIFLTNSTVSGNEASGYGGRGGGIRSEGTVSVVNSTITQNSASHVGGGIGFSTTAHITITDSIVAGNTDNGTAPDLLAPDDVANQLVVNHSLIGDTTGSGVATTTGAANILDQAALLGPLAFNGSPTKTHALLSGSPAIDAGNSTESFDQRGLPRVVDLAGIGNGANSNGADIGAFERQTTEPLSNPPVVTSFTRDEGGILSRPDLLDTISVSFDVDVGVTADDLEIRNDTLGEIAVDLSGLIFGYTTSTKTATWDFSNLTLDPAFYSFELSDDIVSVAGNLSLDGDEDGNPGNRYIAPIYVALQGDANLDGDVDISQVMFVDGMIRNLGDASSVLANLGNSTSQGWEQGDLNGDGDVDVSQLDFTTLPPKNFGDASILLANLQQSVATDQTSAEPTSAIVIADTTSFLDLSLAVQVDDNGGNTTVTLNVAAGTFSTPIDGSGIGDGVTATLVDPQTIALVGAAVDINDYLENPSSLKYTPVAGALGENATTIGVSIDAGDAQNAFSINLDIREPNSLLVNTAIDDENLFDGVTSLRDAINFANLRPGVDTITFDGSVFTGGAASVVRLTHGELVVNDQLTIDGSSGTGIVITADADGNDVTVSGTFVTNVTASLAANADSLDDNSRAINFASGTTGALTLSDLTVTGGRTTGILGVGGGVYARSGSISLTNSILSGNSTSGYDADGGGIYTRSGDVSLTNSAVSGNSAQSHGGGIFNEIGQVTLVGSTVSGNSTTNKSGGGIYTRYGAAKLTNSTISGNIANGLDSDAGGIGSFAGTVSLTNSTVTKNSAARNGGGVRVFPTSDNSLTIENSIIADNTASGASPDLHSDPDLGLTINNSLIGVADDLGTIGGDIGNLMGTAAAPLDPLLETLAENGGPTQTHALLAGSPAINAGSNALAVDAGGIPLTGDQRGENRFKFGAVDIGALESDIDVASTVVPKVTNVVRDEGGVLARPDLLSTFAANFNRDVNISAEDLVVLNNTLGTTIDTSSIGFSYDTTNRTATWDFGSLRNLDTAFYSFQLSETISAVVGNLTLDGDANGSAGGNYLESIYVATVGDLNLDGDVDISQIVIGPDGVRNVGDASILLASLPTAADATYYDGDLNGDGDIDISQVVIGPDGVQNVGDASILLASLGQSVVPTGASTLSSTARTAASALAASRNVVPEVAGDAPLTLAGANQNAYQATDDYFAGSDESNGPSDWDDSLIDVEV